MFLNTETDLKEHKISISCVNGVWEIGFQRCLNGLPYQIDRILVGYSEKYGLVSYRNALFSDGCPVEGRISKDQAVAAAEGYIHDERKKLGVDDAVNMSPPAASGPVIVNPGYLRLESPRLARSMHELREARLAWIVSYWVKGDVEVGDVYGIELYVDALTAELLLPYVYRQGPDLYSTSGGRSQ